MSGIELVLKMFPGKAAIPLIEAGAAIGMARQTCYNLHSTKKFPMPVFMRGRKPFVTASSLAGYIDAQNGADSRLESLRTGKVGRPTKADQIARRKLTQVS